MDDGLKEHFQSQFVQLSGISSQVIPYRNLIKDAEAAGDIHPDVIASWKSHLDAILKQKKQLEKEYDFHKKMLTKEKLITASATRPSLGGLAKQPASNRATHM